MVPRHAAARVADFPPRLFWLGDRALPYTSRFGLRQGRYGSEIQSDPFASAAYGGACVLVCYSRWLWMSASEKAIRHRDRPELLADQRPICFSNAAVQREEVGTAGIRQISTLCGPWRPAAIRNRNCCEEASPAASSFAAAPNTERPRAPMRVTAHVRVYGRDSDRARQKPFQATRMPDRVHADRRTPPRY